MRYSVVLALAALTTTAFGAPLASANPTWYDDQNREAMSYATPIRPELDSCVTEEFKNWLYSNSWTGEKCNEADFFCYCREGQAENRQVLPVLCGIQLLGWRHHDGDAELPQHILRESGSCEAEMELGLSRSRTGSGRDRTRNGQLIRLQAVQLEGGIRVCKSCLV